MSLSGRTNLSGGIYRDVEVDSELGGLASRQYIWNTSSLAWEKATGSSGSGNVTVTNFPATQNVDITAQTLSRLNTIQQAQLIPKEYDYIELSYTGSNLTGVIYKTSGSGGTTVATLTLSYTGSQLDSVART
ncbi:MAG TPA: hypothetical protein ENG87_05910 [Candidatus Pacearchaeota archaeon]|nr:hypothetical protein [Candidatus Pacearchaeota archaeon]